MTLATLVTLASLEIFQYSWKSPPEKKKHHDVYDVALQGRDHAQKS